MPTEQAINWMDPSVAASRLPNTRLGKFGKTAMGFGPNSGLSWFHKAGMHGAGSWRIGGIYGSLGLGEFGLFDLPSYGVGNNVTLGQLAGRSRAGKGLLGWKAQAQEYSRITSQVMRKGSWKMRGRLAGTAAFRSIGPAFTGYYAYQGYKEGGVLGGVKGAATSLAIDYATGAALRAAGSLGIPIAVGAAAAFGGYALLKAGRERTRRTKRMEMGEPVPDPFGNSSTMRQRSLQLLQNSQINGRSALGSEAFLMHIPMMR